MDAMIYAPYTLFLSLEELDWSVLHDQISTGMHSLQPQGLWKTIYLVIPDFRLSDSPLGAEVGLMGSWKPETSSPYSDLCAALPGTSLLRAATPWGRGSMCRQSPTPPELQLLEEPSLPKGHKQFLSVVRLSKHRSCRCVQGQPYSVLAWWAELGDVLFLQAGVDTAHVLGCLGLCPTSLTPTARNWQSLCKALLSRSKNHNDWLKKPAHFHVSNSN